MERYSLTHLSNEVLRRELTTKAATEKEATAELLAHIAEFDARKLYLPAAYGSMLTYCVGELGLSEDSAKKRIQVARASREFPGDGCGISCFGSKSACQRNHLYERFSAPQLDHAWSIDGTDN